MEDIVCGYQRLEELLKDKDAEIEQLKREKQEHMLEIQELNAKLVSIQKFATTRSSSPDKKEPPTISFAKLPARPASTEEQQRPISVLANLPAPAVFKGFDIALPAQPPSTEKRQLPISISAGLPARPASTGFGTPWTKFVSSTPSPQMLPPRPPPFHADTKSATESKTLPTLPTWQVNRPEGIAPPPLLHNYTFGAIQTGMLNSTPAPLSQDTPPLFPIRLPHEIKQKGGEASSQKIVFGETSQSPDNEKESNEGPVAQPDS